MKKSFFSLLAALLCCINPIFAQSSMLATLNHDGAVSVFYGATALKEAHEAAVHGDVITLSSGNFVAVDITKAITLRGAGMMFDSITQAEPTIISGDFSINITDSTSERLTYEGIHNNHTVTLYTLNNPTFLKSRFCRIYSNSSKTLIKGASFIHCRVSGKMSLYNTLGTCINCIIDTPGNDSSSSIEFSNCMIRYYQVSGLYNSFFKNCIIYSTSPTAVLPSSNSMFYNVGVNAYSTPNSCLFTKSPNNTNRYVTAATDIFKTYTGEEFEKLDSESFELTDEAKAKYLGMDGTQVGIYGGNLPYDITPTNPQIIKCNVANKSTADGKLSVDIEIKVAE